MNHTTTPTYAPACRTYNGMGGNIITSRQLDRSTVKEPASPARVRGFEIRSGLLVNNTLDTTNIVCNASFNH